jgi:hypothetical protein
MLNNITNFFNLIKTRMVKTQLEAKDVIPIGTRDSSYGGTYKPTLIEYANFVAGLVGGSNGQVLFNDNDTIAGASNLYWDKLNERVGIGTSTPSTTFAIGSGGINRVNLGIQAFEMYTASSVRTVFLGYSSTSGQLILSSAGSNDVVFTAGSFKSISTGNLGLGTTTDSGFKLDVNGTARVSGNLFVNTGSTPSSGLIIGDNTTASLLAYYSGGLYFKVLNTDVMTLTSGPSGGLYIGAGGLQASYKLDVNGTARVTMGASAEFRLGTSSALPAMLYATGSTSYLMRWKNDGSEVYLQGGTFAVLRNTTQEFVLQSNFTYLSAGNLAIGTATNAGFKLDVNGTSRFSDNVFLPTNILIGSGQSITVWNRIMLYDNTNGAINITMHNPGWYIRHNANMSMAGAFHAGSNTSVDASAVLQATSTTQGFLPPRMTSAQRTAIATPAVGLMVYQTDATEGLYIYKSTGWALNS